MAIIPFKPKRKPEPIVTRYQYHLQREQELREDLVAGRASLNLRIEEATTSGEATAEELQVANDTLMQVDALLAEDIQWR